VHLICFDINSEFKERNFNKNILNFNWTI